MMISRLVRSLFKGAVFTLLSAAGCTLFNVFDDVLPPADGTYFADASFAEDAPGIVDVRPDQDEDAADSGPDLPGVIVVGGQIEDDAGERHSVLTALDPASGRELGQREALVVSAIRYDGRRDLWFLFSSSTSDFVPGPTNQVYFHVRTLDLRTGQWTELSKTPVPTLYSYDFVVVLRDRIGYVAYTEPDSGASTTLDFVTLDTALPSSVSVLNRLPVDITPAGAMGTRSTTGAGGIVDLLRANAGACDGSVCPIEFVPIRVPNGGLPVMDPPVEIGTGSASIRPSYGTFTQLNRNMVVFPRVSSDAAAPTTAALFEPATNNREGADTLFFMTDSNLRRAAISECTQTAFFVGTNSDLNVHAVPILGDGGGAPTKAPTGHSGQAVYFEPSSATVLAPFAQGKGFSFSAFRLGGTPNAPALIPRDGVDFIPPADLRPILLGVKEAVPIVCP
jgi:hypothetical protein